MPMLKPFAAFASAWRSPARDGAGTEATRSASDSPVPAGTRGGEPVNQSVGRRGVGVEDPGTAVAVLGSMSEMDSPERELQRAVRAVSVALPERALEVVIDDSGPPMPVLDHGIAGCFAVPLGVSAPRAVDIEIADLPPPDLVVHPIPTLDEEADRGVRIF